MVDALIFSRERPCQLDLLLRSIRRHARHLYDNVTVLLRAESEDALRGYLTLWTEHPWARIMKERRFEDDVRFWLSRAGDTVSFLVDDDVFYRQAPMPDVLPFSYRGGDYDYPLSLDGNVYRRADILTVLEGMPAGWSNPTQMEACMHEYRSLTPFDRVHPCVPPCLTGVPANVVSESSGMPSMGVDVAMLNREFLRGKRIDLSRLEIELMSRPPAAHTSVEYVLA